MTISCFTSKPLCMPVACSPVRQKVYLLRNWDCRVWPRSLVRKAADASRTENARVLIPTLNVVLARHACSCSGTWLAHEKIALVAHPITERIRRPGRRLHAAIQVSVTPPRPRLCSGVHLLRFSDRTADLRDCDGVPFGTLLLNLKLQKHVGRRPACTIFLDVRHGFHEAIHGIRAAPGLSWGAGGRRAHEMGACALLHMGLCRTASAYVF